MSNLVLVVVCVYSVLITLNYAVQTAYVQMGADTLRPDHVRGVEYRRGCPDDPDYHEPPAYGGKVVTSMRILVFGAGAIGSIYGYFLSRAGSEVTHYVRAQRAAQLADGLSVNILDGRNEKNVREIRDVYPIRTVTEFSGDKRYDLILVSIKHGSLDAALTVLRDQAVTGDIVFFNGLWKDYASIDRFVDRGRYLWGYPVAGGNIDYDSRTLTGAVLDHIMLGETDGRRSERLEAVSNLFASAGIKTETPRDILHWVWIHMAINAGVISTCLKYGSAQAFMNSARALREGILTMREGLKVVQGRGVNLKLYQNEIRMYYMPAWIGAALFKYYFKKNLLSRRIMELHNNMEDLYELCNDVYASAQELGIETPRLTAKAGYFLGKS